MSNLVKLIIKLKKKEIVEMESKHKFVLKQEDLDIHA